jgi:hypothetical protein
MSADRRRRLIALLVIGFVCGAEADSDNPTAFNPGRIDTGGVIPLPDRPLANIDELIAILLPYKHSLQSGLGQTQLALWVRRLEQTDLQRLRGSITPFWSAGNGYDAAAVGLTAALDHAIASKLADSKKADDRWRHRKQVAERRKPVSKAPSRLHCNSPMQSFAPSSSSARRK